jgi:hypothetical protein
MLDTGGELMRLLVTSVVGYRGTIEYDDVGEVTGA